MISTAKRTLIFLTGNTVAQATMSLSGLLLARWLSVPDYALYSIVIAMTGAITVLTKAGVDIGYTALLGRHWPDMTRAGELTRAAMKVRRRVSIVMLPLILITTGYTLWKNGASPGLTAILLVFLVVFWVGDMSTRIVDQILFFDKQSSRLQLLDTIIAVVRLGAILAVFFAGWLGLIWAAAINSLAALARIPLIWRWIRQFLPAQTFDLRQDDTEEIWKAVKKQMPVTLFFVFQSQIVLLVLSIFAGSAQVAGYGALTRLTQLLVPVQAFVYAIAVPIFAKRKHKLGRTLSILVGLCAVPGVLLVLLSLTAPWVLLWLVGPHYADLQNEVVLACLMAAVNRTAGAFRNLVSYKGWLTFNWLSILINISWIASGPFLFDLGTVSGALMFQTGFAIGPVVSALADFTYNSRKTG
ncbi:lipopolysaccharide biosynthesis protein [Acidimangrovimonas sediminis]|uniref:lipopolysaccharide biosynthesis protein n=1 Tax=Acidimangrovimonas sediminis TaxID=2056283 RepID=UPI000C7FC193|nr:oligosaccharide flippase family protein [Acidimangrovimonas sediminis]